MKEVIITFLKEYSWLIGVLAVLGIEIAPIKINPLRFIGKLIIRAIKSINNAIHHDINQTLNSIVDRLDKMEHDNDMKDVMEIKNKLCNYKVILQTTGLDEFQYTRCFELIEKYKFYQEKYKGEVNGHMDAVVKFIETQYNNGVINQSFEGEINGESSKLDGTF